MDANAAAGFLAAFADKPAVMIGVTLVAYAIGQAVHARFPAIPIFNPTLIGIVLVAGLIEATRISYASYQQGTQLLTFILAPAVVVLAVPLYRRIGLVKRSWPIVGAALMVGLPAGLLTTISLAHLCGAKSVTLLSLVPKTVTAGIAVGVSQTIGGVPNLTAVFVVLTGISGAVCGPWLLRMMGVKDHRVIGLAMGVCSHGIGTAKAFQISEVAGAFSSVAMALNGLLTAILLPLLLYALMKTAPALFPAVQVSSTQVSSTQVPVMQEAVAHALQDLVNGAQTMRLNAGATAAAGAVAVPTSASTTLGSATTQGAMTGPMQYVLPGLEGLAGLLLLRMLTSVYVHTPHFRSKVIVGLGGKLKRFTQAGHALKLPMPFERIAGCADLTVQIAAFSLDLKTKENIFVALPIEIHYEIVDPIKAMRLQDGSDRTHFIRNLTQNVVSAQMAGSDLWAVHASCHDLDHVHDFGSIRSKIMNVIDSKGFERDLSEKPASTFSHPALATAIRNALRRDLADFGMAVRAVTIERPVLSPGFHPARQAAASAHEQEAVAEALQAAPRGQRESRNLAIAAYRTESLKNALYAEVAQAAAKADGMASGADARGPVRMKDLAKVIVAMRRNQAG